MPPNNQPQVSRTNPAAAYAPYGTFIEPKQPGFFGNMLNAFGYANDFINAVNQAPAGVPGIIPGLAAIGQRKNIRDYLHQTAQQERAKRMELAKWANAVPPDVMADMEQQMGLSPGSLKFGNETFMSPEQIGNIQHNMGLYRQVNMGKLPMYGPMAPAAQTAQSAKDTLEQRRKVANFDAGQQVFGSNPFQAGQQASGVNQAEGQRTITLDEQGRPVNVSTPDNPQLMYMQEDPALEVQKGKPPGVISGSKIGRTIINQIMEPHLAGGVRQNQPYVQDIDPHLLPTDYPAQATQLFTAGVGDARGAAGHQLNVQKEARQTAYQQKQMQEINSRIQKLAEETKWLGPKAQAYIYNLTRSKGGRAPSREEVAREMMKNGEISKDEYKAFILGSKAGQGGKGNKVTPGVLESLSKIKKGYTDSRDGWLGFGTDPRMQEFYRNTYNQTASQYGLPHLPGIQGPQVQNPRGRSGRTQKPGVVNINGVDIQL